MSVKPKTPLPWKYEAPTGMPFQLIVSHTGKIVTDNQPGITYSGHAPRAVLIHKDDMQYIVEACNAYEELKRKVNELRMREFNRKLKEYMRSNSADELLHNLETLIKGEKP